MKELVSWIQEQVKEAKCDGVVFGMSGGIDSSIIAVLCKQAYPEKSLGVIMPCDSNPSDKKHALLLAGLFDIKTVTVSLGTTWDLLVNTIPLMKSEPKRRVIAQANVKSRLRMTTLYCLANQLNYLVVGTSNKSELLLGYFTKYGDGGVDIEPLGNIYKTEEKKIAQELGIPKEIIDKPPSAGLWKGQKTEDEIGLSYTVIDKYLKSGKEDVRVALKLNALIIKNRHKLMSPPSPLFKETV